jgi:hypothetical protein
MDMYVRAYERRHAENDVQKDEDLSYGKCEACQPIYDRTETLVSKPRNDATGSQFSHGKHHQSPGYCRGLIVKTMRICQ